MRKRKVNPSLEVAGLNLEENAALEEHTVVATLTQPTGSISDAGVPAIRRPTNAVDVATEETIVPPWVEGVVKETVQPVVAGTGTVGPADPYHNSPWQTSCEKRKLTWHATMGHTPTGFGKC